MENRLCIEVLEHINVVVSTRVNTFMPFLFFFRVDGMELSAWSGDGQTKKE